MMLDVVKSEKETVAVIGISHKKRPRADALNSLRELKLLVQAAGGHVTDELFCQLDRIHSSTFVGHGKTREIAILVGEKSVDLVAFDELLSPAQQRNLESELNCRVIDRSGVILDIFAQRARSKEGKLQVELAQTEYLLPRLTHLWTHFSRLGAGIGTRGPGETQLEIDRRRLKSRMMRIRQELEKIKKRRGLQRKYRSKHGLRSIAIVGYTNAGKSTLLNKLTGSAVEVKDQLFATLDPTIRVLELPGKDRIVISDTVGFISNLPHQLIAAFRATLEEVVQADVLLQVIDAAAEDRENHVLDVDKVLAELSCRDKPVLLVYNKTDLNPEYVPGSVWEETGRPAVAVSAEYGTGIEQLLNCIESMIKVPKEKIVLKIPYSDSGVFSKIRANFEILQTNYLESAIEVMILASPSAIGRLQQYQVEREYLNEINQV